jgi:F0F1-type ATP synthase membrane subunit c/vacuolar-type H+-ATPase subunit K
LLSVAPDGQSCAIDELDGVWLGVGVGIGVGVCVGVGVGVCVGVCVGVVVGNGRGEPQVRTREA